VYRNWATFNFVFADAILDFWLPVSSDSISDGAIEKFTPENIGIDTGIMFLSPRIAELLVTLPPPRGPRYKIRSAVRGLTWKDLNLTQDYSS